MNYALLIYTFVWWSLQRYYANRDLQVLPF